jgi:hypothetical protein
LSLGGGGTRIASSNLIGLSGFWLLGFQIFGFVLNYRPMADDRW